MSTLAQDLRATLQHLDANSCPDDVYKTAFSTFAKKPLCKGETWRSRLVAWCDAEIKRELQTMLAEMIDCYGSDDGGGPIDIIERAKKTLELLD